LPFRKFLREDENGENGAEIRLFFVFLFLSIF